MSVALDEEHMEPVAEGIVAKIDEDKRLVFGWASIIKDERNQILLDRQDDFIDSEDELENAAYQYVLNSRDGGEMHIRKGVSTMVESIVLTKEKQEALGIAEGAVPIGWWIGFRVNDDRVWDQVKKGEYVGFSVHGTGKRESTVLKDGEYTEVGKAERSLKEHPTNHSDEHMRLMRKLMAEGMPMDEAHERAMEEVGKADPDPERLVRISKPLLSLLTKAQLAKGGPGSGENPGHNFRGNQWTKGIKGKNKSSGGKKLSAVQDLKSSEKLTLKPEAVEGFLQKLGKEIEAAEKAGDPTPNVNLCKITVPGTNLFCGASKGIPRKDMPQLGGKPREGSAADKLPKKNGEADGAGAFVKHLEDMGNKVTVKKVKASSLKASQNELVGAKVVGMKNSKSFDPMSGAIFVSKDGYVIDGHHRWASQIARDYADGDLGDLNMGVQVVDMKIEDVLKEANSWADKFGILPKEAKTKVKKNMERDRFSPIERPEILKGDSPGHPFRGNQHVDAEGARESKEEAAALSRDKAWLKYYNQGRKGKDHYDSMLEYVMVTGDDSGAGSHFLDYGPSDKDVAAYNLKHSKKLRKSWTPLRLNDQRF